MEDDALFQRFQQRPVPTPPGEITSGVRKRVNTSLLGLQLADFLLGAIPAALAGFAPALLDAAKQTAQRSVNSKSKPR